MESSLLTLETLRKIGFAKYKIIFKKNGKCLLQSRNLLNFIVVDNYGLNIYKNIKQNDKQSRNHLSSFRNNPSLSRSIGPFIKQINIIKQNKNDFSLPKRNGLVLSLFLTMNCNHYCSYCIRDAGTSLNNELSNKEWLVFSKEVEEAVKRYGIKRRDFRVHINGGEPTLSPSFLKLANSFIRMGAKIFIFTNGSRPEMIKKIGKNLTQLDGVQVSLHTLGPTFFNKETGKLKKHLLKAFDTISYLINKNVSITIVVMVSAQNFKEICEKLCLILKKYILQPSKVEVALNLPTLRGRCTELDLPQTRYTMGRVSQQLRKIKDELLESGFKECHLMYSKNKPSPIYLTGRDCNYGHQINIFPNGDVSACEVPMEGLNIRNINFHDVLQEGFSYQEKYRFNKSPACKVCSLKYVCGGGCRTQNYIFYGKVLRERCPQYFKNDIKNKLFVKLDSVFYANGKERKVNG